MVCRCKGIFHNEARHILAVKTHNEHIAKMGRILYRIPVIKIGVQLLEIIILSTITITLFEIQGTRVQTSVWSGPLLFLPFPKFYLVQC